MTDLWLSGVLFQPLNTQKLVFGRGSAPDPAAGAYAAPSDPLVGWGGDIPSSYSSVDLGAEGASVVSPPTQIPGYVYVSDTFRNHVSAAAVFRV